MKHLSVAIIALLIPATALAAGAAMFLLLPLAGLSEGRPFRFDELARVGRLSGFTLSPDGKWIAFAVTTPDLDENRSRSAIWSLVSPAATPIRMVRSRSPRSAAMSLRA